LFCHSTDERWVVLTAYYVELAGPTGSGSCCPRASNATDAERLARFIFRREGYHRLVACAALPDPPTCAMCGAQEDAHTDLRDGVPGHVRGDTVDLPVEQQVWHAYTELMPAAGQQADSR
jgi:hypothetical protein